MKITLATCLLALAIPSFNITWAPHLESLGASKRVLGLASSVFMLTVGLAGYLGGELSSRNYRFTAVLGCVIGGLSFGLLAIARTQYLFIAAGIVWELNYGVVKPALSTWVNELVESEKRATLLSLRSTVASVSGIAGLAVMGVLSDLGTPILAFKWGLTAYLVAALVLALS